MGLTEPSAWITKLYWGEGILTLGGTCLPLILWLQSHVIKLEVLSPNPSPYLKIQLHLIESWVTEEELELGRNVRIIG